MGHTNIEIQHMDSQIAQAKMLIAALPKMVDILNRIATHLETIAVTSEALLDDNFTDEDTSK